MMKKIALAALILMACYSTASAQLRQITVNPAEQSVQDTRSQGVKLIQFYDALNRHYVDTINNAKLVEDAIVKMLDNLDPHSTYLTPEEMKESEESFSGRFSGIGVEFNVLRDTLMVVNTVPNGPAENVGVRPNDRIISVNGESVIGITTTKVPKILRGPKGTVADIEVVRRGESDRLSFRIIRDDIPDHTIDAAYKIDDKTGYIKVNRFALSTMDEFAKAFNEMGDIDALILDLRNNGGGLMDQGVLMSNFFLPIGSTIVSARGRTIPPVKYAARLQPRFPTGKVVILMDETSASASEIVAGALQDWDRAVVVGRRSFGKGLIQSQIPLGDGSAVRITTAHYYTPSGRDIQRPYEKGHKEEYYKDLAQRFRADYVDSVGGGEKYKTLRLHRDIFGGGGIYPDIYVTADTTGYSDYWSRLHRQSVIRDYVLEYMDANRDRLLREYPDYEKFDRSFEVSDDMIDAIVKLGEEHGIPHDPEGMKVSREHIEIQLKALIAQKLWTMNEFFRIIRKSDICVSKAIEVIGNWGEMSGLASD